MVHLYVIKFKYTGIFDCHYRYRGAVENNNSLRYDGRTKSKIGLNSAWGTTWWPILVFTFFVSCSEVNA